MEDYSWLMENMGCNCPQWIDRATAQQRYNIPDKKWKKLQRKRFHVVRLYWTKPVKYWEPDIQRMLECDRTGTPCAESDLTPIYFTDEYISNNALPAHVTLLCQTMAFLSYWTMMPWVGFYADGLSVPNIILLILASGFLFCSTPFGYRIYQNLRKKYVPRRRFPETPIPTRPFKERTPDDFFNLN